MMPVWIGKTEHDKWAADIRQSLSMRKTDYNRHDVLTPSIYKFLATPAGHRNT